MFKPAKEKWNLLFNQLSFVQLAIDPFGGFFLLPKSTGSGCEMKSFTPGYNRNFPDYI